MADLLNVTEIRVHPGRRFEAMIEDVRVGDQPGFATRSVEAAELALDGMVGDGHRGLLRKSGGREPWYPRGTEMRSGRQLSIVSVEELAVIAADLDLPVLDPGLIGANVVMSGVPRLSFLPAGTRLFLTDGAVIVVEAQNAPCRFAGRALVGAHPGRPDLELGFAKAGARRRGLVASVERAGALVRGRTVSIRTPEQWLYPGP